MTTEMSAGMDTSVAMMSGVADTIEKALKKSLSASNVASVAKGLEDVESFRKAVGDVPVTKSSGPKKLAFSQWMKMQGSLMEQFVQLVMQFLPMLVAADSADATVMPAAEGQGDVDMAKTVEMAVAKSQDAILSRMETMFAERMETRFGAVTEQLTAISKSRDVGNAIPAGKPPEGEGDNDPCIPFTSLTERMRAKGQLPKAS